MKTSRFQFEYRKSASKLHRAVGEILRSSPRFKHYRVYQEYPVNRVNTSYQDSSHHFDWVIQDLHLVIECHGQQHFKATDFSGELTPEEIELAFQDLKRRDSSKKQAALDAGWTFIEVPFSDQKKIDESYIWNLYQENYNAKAIQDDSGTREDSGQDNRDSPAMGTDVAGKYKAARKEASRQYRQEYLRSDTHQAELERARQYKHEQYIKQKERLKDASK